MNSSDIAWQRLRRQHIVDTAFTDPHDVVAWMGAVQAQDYLGSLWAIGLRTRDAAERSIEAAVAARTIVRTWPMRGTLHFVAAEDVKWMVELLAPRAVARAAGRRRQLGLDDNVLDRSKAAVIAALEGGKQVRRAELYQALAAANIAPDGQRGLHILGHLAQEGLICFGCREGKQPTFVLLDEWVPQAKRMEREAALAELTQRYFTSHGPATLQDFTWWSGLTTAEAKAGLSLVGTQLIRETVGQQTYWLPQYTSSSRASAPSMTLLPAFDEYVLGYRERSAILDPRHRQYVHPGNNGMFSPTIVHEARIVGTWRRGFKQGQVVVTPVPFEPLTGHEWDGLVDAAAGYARFVGHGEVQVERCSASSS